MAVAIYLKFQPIKPDDKVRFLLMPARRRPGAGCQGLSQSTNLILQSFIDPKTGAWFNSQAGVLPERDAKGELAFRAMSYTPW